MANISVGIPRVLVVDNKQEELDQITRALHSALIPCLPVLYNSADWPDSAPGKVNTAIRLVFLDLNLADATAPSAKTIVPHTVEVLKHLVIDGPYVLVFWSKHAEIAEEVIELMRERYTEEVVPPIKWLAINKLDFQISDTQETKAEPKKTLSELVASLLNEPSTLLALSNWEARVMNSVAATVSRLFAIAADRDPWDFEGTNQRLEGLLTWIAHEAVGRQIAKMCPSEALEQGLVAALGDDLSRTQADPEYIEAWLAAMPNLGKAEFAHDPAFATHLNQVFHIDASVTDILARGTFRFISDGNSTNEKCKEIFGQTIKALKGEFLNISSIPEDQRTDVLESCKLGLVELSASCDYAQRKDRSYRFVLATIIPIEYSQFALFGDAPDGGVPPKLVKHDAVYRLPAFQVAERAFVCKLNFRHILGLPATSPVLGEAYFRIRAPLLDEIAYRCSSHLARPGIVAFH
jgi:hypothetical protein